jgi:hypothetical protein
VAALEAARRGVGRAQVSQELEASWDAPAHLSCGLSASMEMLRRAENRASYEKPERTRKSVPRACDAATATEPWWRHRQTQLLQLKPHDARAAAAPGRAAVAQRARVARACGERARRAAARLQARRRTEATTLGLRAAGTRMRRSSAPGRRRECCMLDLRSAQGAKRERQRSGWLAAPHATTTGLAAHRL